MAIWGGFAPLLSGAAQQQSAVNYSITCSPGSYTYTGSSATITRNRSLSASSGSYTYTGSSAVLTHGAALNHRSLTANAGSYTYTSLTVDAQGRITSASNGTTPVTSVTSGNTTRISIGGTATAPTVDLVTSGVTADTYTSATITVDAYGRVTSASTGAASGATLSDVFMLMGA